jgi:mycothiol-dependent nitroreductase-like protein
MIADPAARDSVAVDYYLDPFCPWAWITSRWLVEIAERRSLDIRWRSFSLVIRDGGIRLSPKMPVERHAAALAGRQMAGHVLQVFEAVRAEHGEEAVGRVYTEFGRRVHTPGRLPGVTSNLLRDALEAADLDVGIEARATDPVWQAAVKTSTDQALAMVGADAETPIVVLAESGPIGVSGPMLSWVPTGDAALRLWDAMRTLAEEPAFGEARRARPMPMRFPILD